MAEREITDPSQILDIADDLRFDNPPAETRRVCPEHGRDIDITYAPTNSSDPDNARARATVSGCCDAAIDDYLERIRGRGGLP
jgi:hypothetical protein